MSETRYIDVTCGAVSAKLLRASMPAVLERIRKRRSDKRLDVETKNYEKYLEDRRQWTEAWEAYTERSRWKRFWYCFFHGGRPGKPEPLFGSPQELMDALDGYGSVNLTDKGGSVRYATYEDYTATLKGAQRIYDMALLATGYIKLTSDDAFFLGRWLDEKEMQADDADADDVRGILDAVLS
jgi:hypothetical protein